MRRLTFLVAAVLLAGCAGAPAVSRPPSDFSTATPSVPETPGVAPSSPGAAFPEPSFDIEAAARSACAKATIENCVETLIEVAPAYPGYLVALCVGDTGYQFLAVVESAAELEGACSKIHPGRMVAWLQVPADPTSSPTASPSGAPSPLASGTPSLAPSKTTAPSPCPLGTFVPGGFEMTSALVVNVETLNVRNGPCRAATLFTRIKRGKLLLNMGGPVSIDGYRWYTVALDLTGDLPTAGWVAAGTTADTWLRPASLSCPVPSLATIADLGAIEQQACWGHSQSLSFVAHQAATPPDAGFGGGCGELDPNQPAWLWCWNINYNFVNSDGGPLGSGQPTLQLFFDPYTGIKPLGLAPVGTIGPAYQIRGHFYDRWASLCPPASTQGTIDFDRAVLRCQVEFVVEALQRVP